MGPLHTSGFMPHGYCYLWDTWILGLHVVSDGLSGTELAQAVLQIRPDVPVVLTSGYIRTRDQEVAKRVGVRELVLKPDTIENFGRHAASIVGTSAEEIKSYQRVGDI